MTKRPHNSVGITTLVCVAFLAVCIAQDYPKNIQEVKDSATYDESKSFNVAQASQYSSVFQAASGDATKGLAETVGNAFADIDKAPAAVHSSTQIAGCEDKNGCASVKFEDGRITSSFGDQRILEGAPLDEATGGKEFHVLQTNVPNAGLPVNGPFWWMTADSPFRNAYQAYLKFKSTGVPEPPSVCTPTGCTFSGPDSATAPSVHIEGTPADIKNNPYINGQFEALAEQYLKSQSQNSQSGQFKINVSQNPFLNGQISSAGSAYQQTYQSLGGGSSRNSESGSISSESQSSDEEQRFIDDQESGSVVSGITGSGVIVTGSAVGGEDSSSSSSSSSGSEEIDDVLQTQTGFGRKQQQFGGTAQSAGFDANGGGELLVSCTGKNRICVPRSQCFNGVVANGLIRGTGSKKCRTSSEVCCKLNSEYPGGLPGSVGAESSESFGIVKAEGEAQRPISGFSPPSQVPSNAIDTSYFTQNTFRPGSEAGQKPGIPYLPPVTEGSLLLDETRSPTPTAPTTPKYIPVKTRPSSKRPYTPIKTKPRPTTAYYPTYTPEITRLPYIPPRTTLAPLPYFPPRTTPAPLPYVPPRTTLAPYIPPVVTPAPYIPPPVTPAPYIPPAVTPAPYIPPRVTPAPYIPPRVTPAPYIPPRVTPAPYIPPPVTPAPYIPPSPRPVYNTYRPPTKAPEYLPPKKYITTTKAPYKTGSILLDETRTTPGITPTASLAGCAAALLCTPEEFCTAEGVISNTTIYLSDYQKTFRVPITDCIIPNSGQPGKCCRDPYYTDPWPTNQLGQWIPGAFGDTGAYTPNGPQFSPRPRPTTPSPVTGGIIREGFRRPFIPPTPVTSPAIIGSGSNNYLTGNLLLGEFQDGQFGYGYGQCGIRRPGVPQGNPAQLEVDFAEIPWQAMILLRTNKSLLCGGVITRPEVVITTASCVEGLRAGDVQVKGGEWKLGVDEEPLPFQILTVRQIIVHPGYARGGLANDVAILVLQSAFQLADNIYPICLPSENESIEQIYQGTSNCITTGWGKKVLQSHIPNALMHAVNLDILNEGECQQKLQNYPSFLRGYDRKSCICGQTKNAYENICKVDTGSALACDNGSGHWILRGVYSWDTGCDVQNQFAGFYKFDVEWYWHALGLRVSTKYTIYQNLPSYFPEDTRISQEITRLPGFVTNQGFNGRRPGGIKGQVSGFLPGPTVTPLPAIVSPAPLVPALANQGLGIIQVPGTEQGLVNVQYQGQSIGQRPSINIAPIVVPEQIPQTAFTFPPKQPTFVQSKTTLVPAQPPTLVTKPALIPQQSNVFIQSQFPSAQGQANVFLTGNRQQSLLPTITGQEVTFTGIAQPPRPQAPVLQTSRPFVPGLQIQGPQTPRPPVQEIVPFIPEQQTPRPLGTVLLNQGSQIGVHQTLPQPGLQQSVLVAQTPRPLGIVPQTPRPLGLEVQGISSRPIGPALQRPGYVRGQGVINVPGSASEQGTIITQNQGQKYGSGYIQSSFGVPGFNSVAGVLQVPTAIPSVISSIAPSVLPSAFPSTVATLPVTSQGQGLYTLTGSTGIPLVQNEGVSFVQKSESIPVQSTIKNLFETSFNQPRPAFGSTIIKNQGSSLNGVTNLINQQELLNNYGQRQYGIQGSYGTKGSGLVIKGQPQSFLQTSGFSNVQNQGSLFQNKQGVLSGGGVVKQFGQGSLPGPAISTGPTFVQGFVSGPSAGSVQGQYEYKQSIGPLVGGYQFQQEEIIPESAVAYQYESKKLLPKVTSVIPGQRVEYQYNTQNLIPAGGNLQYQVKAERTVVPQVSGGHYKVSYQTDLSQPKPQIQVQYQSKEFGKPPTSGSYTLNGLPGGQLPTIVPPAVSQFGLKDAFALNNQAQASDLDCECLDEYA